MSSFAAFMRERLGEMLLLVLACSALFSTVCFGFHIADGLKLNYALVAAVELVLVVLFTALSYSPRTALWGSVGFALACTVALGVSAGLLGVNVFADTWENPCVFFILGIAVAAVVYVLSRRKAGALVCLVGGALVVVLIEFLYGNGLVVQGVLFLIAMTALYLYRCHKSAFPVIAEGDMTRWQAVLMPAALCAAAALVAGLVFALVIAPLQPPAMELKLVTKHYALETVYVNGQLGVEEKENPDLKSDDAAQTEDETNNLTDNENPLKGDQSTDDDTGQGEGNPLGTDGATVNGAGDAVDAIRYQLDFPTLFAALLCVLLAALAAVLVKLWLRKRRLAAIFAREPGEAVVGFYRFFEKRLKGFGYAKPEAQTLREYAAAGADALHIMEQGAGEGAVATMAEAYCGWVYGMRVPSEAEVEACRRLSEVFYENLRRLVGSPKYLLRFFLL